MAVGQNNFSDIPYTSESGGGGIHYDPNDVSSAQAFYDSATGQYGFRMPDGSVLGSRPAPFYDANNPGGKPSNYNTSQYQNAQNRALRDQGRQGGNSGLMSPTQVVPNAALGANGGPQSTTPGGGGGGGGLPLALKKLAAGVIPAVVGRTIGGGGSNELSPELQQLLAMAIQRMTQQQPLFNSINAQAMAGLPTAYQQK
jgi:hypothetical protein